MRGVRRRLSWLICGWLLCQAAGMAASPFSAWCDLAASADDETKCCPGLLPGQICPMHHTREGDRTCKMRSACGQTDPALFSLSGGVGLLPPPTPTVSAFDPGQPLDPLVATELLRAERPESPPPRA
jgi:hypothetical protein